MKKLLLTGLKGTACKQTLKKVFSIDNINTKNENQVAIIYLSIYLSIDLKKRLARQY